MIPPINGMQASAAATLEGKPVDVDFGPSSGPGPDAGGGGIGSCSGMIYIHRMQNGLSSNLTLGLFFAFASRPSAISCAPNPRFMTKSSPPPVERAFTLMEVLVVMAIIIGLAAILIPSLRSALESAKATKDLSNLRQSGTLMQAYLNDKDGILPVINAAPGIGTNGPP